MKIFFTTLAFLIITSALITAQRDASKEEHLFVADSQLTQRLDETCHHFVKKGLLSGGVSIIAHKGEVIYQHAYGMQSIEEKQSMKMDALFRIASMTKPITTAALLLLVEEGRLSLDDKAGDYLPQMDSMKVLEKDGRLQTPRRPITIRHLLMHTSGTRSRVDPWFKKNGIEVSEASSLEDYVDRLLKAPLVFHPGEGFNYAMNNDICARIVEILTGENFGDYLKHRLLEPLEMNDTWYVVPQSELDRLCSIYRYDRGQLHLVEGKEAVQSAFPRGNGQMVSTAQDYMNFLLMLLNKGLFKGKRVLREESIQSLTSYDLPADIPLKVGNTSFPNTGFGLSLAISRRTAQPWTPLPVRFENLFQHLPRGSFMWPGITNTYFWVDPENEITGLVLSQSANPGQIGNFQAFTQTFYRHFFSRQPLSDRERRQSLDMLRQSLDKLKQLTSGLSEAQLNYKPGEGRWSIKNNVDHLVKVEEVVWSIIQEALARPGEGRQVDISDEELIARLSTRTEKYTAPPTLKPMDSNYGSFEAAWADFKEKRQRTLSFVEKTEAPLRGHFAQNPVFGNMDVYQWTLHLSAHCYRHIEQVEDILADRHFPN